MSKALKKFRNLVWWAALFSGPTIYVADSFFDWLHRTHTGLTVIYLFFYYGALIVFFLKEVFVEGKFRFATLLFGLVFGIALAFNTPNFLSVLGFRWYAYPEKKFIADRCHLVEFAQDGKHESVGFCDLKLDESGQIESFSVFYDTSGDVANDYNIETDKHKPDRKEWVVAIRKLFDDDPNEQFENLAFQAYPICDHFYTLYFNLPAVVGFTAEYGAPPPNPKNNYEDYNF